MCCFIIRASHRRIEKSARKSLPLKRPDEGKTKRNDAQITITDQREMNTERQTIKVQWEKDKKNKRNNQKSIRHLCVHAFSPLRTIPLLPHFTQITGPCSAKRWQKPTQNKHRKERKRKTINKITQWTNTRQMSFVHK